MVEKVNILQLESVLNEYGLHDLPMITIAKGKFRNSGNETFFHNGKTFKFEKKRPNFLLFTKIKR